MRTCVAWMLFLVVALVSVPSAVAQEPLPDPIGDTTIPQVSPECEALRQTLDSLTIQLASAELDYWMAYIAIPLCVRDIDRLTAELDALVDEGARALKQAELNTARYNMGYWINTKNVAEERWRYLWGIAAVVTADMNIAGCTN